MSYYRRDLIKIEHPEIVAEWDEWLENSFDVGNYDAYKERDQSILPYIDGNPQWVVDTYMPPHIEEKMKAVHLVDK